jgi:photosystem II stability/assembly factor-like uncharacterized protein
VLNRVPSITVLTTVALACASSLAQALTTTPPTDQDGNRAIHTPPSPSVNSHPHDPTTAVGQWTPFGPAGATARTVAAHPTIANLAVAGVNLGFGGAIYHTTTGTFWSPATGTGTRAINVLEFASTGKGWAATDDGLFTSADNGQTWTPVTLPIAGQAIVRAFAIDPTNPNNLWIGISQFLGGTSPLVVFKSTTNGASWTDVSPPVSPGMGATTIEVDPANPQRVYAAFTPNFGGANELWVTTDGGASWAERSAGTPNVPINDIAFGNGKAYVVGGQDFGSQFMGLWTTSDDGLNWSDDSSAWPSRAATFVALDPSNSQQILVGTTRAGLARSTNAGTDWTFSAGKTASFQVNAIEFAPSSPSTIYLGMSSLAILRSTNGGNSFTPSGGGISNLEIISISANPLNPSEIAAAYVGDNDGGIYTTTDAGETWTLSSAPLPRWQKVYFAPDGTLYACHNGPLGRADDGLWKRNTDGSWTNLTPASPGTLNSLGNDIVAYPGSNPVVLLAGSRNIPFSTPFAQIHSYNRAGPGAWELEYESTTFGNVNSLAIKSGGTAVAGMISFYGEAGHVLRSTDTGDTWPTAENGYNANWHAWDVSVGASGEFYLAASPDTGGSPGVLFKSPDGLNWTAQGPTVHARTMVADPVLASTIYIVGAFGGERPRRSIDDGASFQLFDQGYIPGPGARELSYGYTVNGASRLYMGTSSGAFAVNVAEGTGCGTSDFNGDGDFGTDQDIEAFFACLAGVCCPTCFPGGSDFNGDGDFGTDQDIEAFFRVLAGGTC